MLRFDDQRTKGFEERNNTKINRNKRKNMIQVKMKMQKMNEPNLMIIEAGILKMKTSSGKERIIIKEESKLEEKNKE